MGTISTEFDVSDQVFCICQVIEEKREYNDTKDQLFTDFKKAYVSVRRIVF
jgi:hypothetical protein